MSLGVKAQNTTVYYNDSFGYYTFIDTGCLFAYEFKQEDSNEYIVFNYTVADYTGKFLFRGYVKYYGVEIWRQMADADIKRKFVFDNVKAQKGWK